MELNKLTAHELAALLSKREVSAKETVCAYLEKQDKHSAFITVCADSALIQAEDIDKRRIKGDNLPRLAGIPIAVKDNICTKGIKTTCASQILSNFVPGYNSSVVERLYQNQLIILDEAFRRGT